LAQSIYEKDKMNILEALKKCRPYFLTNQPTITTYQQSLEFLGSPRLLEGIQHKLMLKPLDFDYKIEYEKGSKLSGCRCTFWKTELKFNLLRMQFYHPGSMIWWNLTS
jgi:hypothetical protein